MYSRTHTPQLVILRQGLLVNQTELQQVCLKQSPQRRKHPEPAQLRPYEINQGNESPDLN